MKEQKILLIDNYDSFTYNLLHYIEELTGSACVVVRNNNIDIGFVECFDSLILSPGPGMPDEANQLLPVIDHFFKKKKMLGVCLGHQALAMVSGGRLRQLSNVMHGVQRSCTVINDSDPVLKGIPDSFPAGRYHSWVIDKASLNNDWIVSSEDEEGNIMSMFHRKLPLHGVQYHPESIMTHAGKKMLLNWLNI